MIDIVLSQHSSFYRGLWNGRFHFSDLPAASRADLIRVPLSERRYKEATSLVKIVGTGDSVFLSEWALEDIAREPFGTPATRPLVYMSEPHESIEKCMWFYENRTLPLIGEPSVEVAAAAAAKYRVDSIITDPAALLKLAPRMHTMCDDLESITIIGTSFDPKELMFARAFARRVRLLFAFPETGAIAQAELQASPEFEAVPNCLVEKSGSDILVTKLASLVTPIIKYKTTMPEGMTLRGV